MIVKEFDYVKGNTVVKPTRKSKESNKKQKELERAKRNKQKRQHEKQRKTRMACLQIAAVIFFGGFFIVHQDTKVYQKQRELASINNEIRVVTDNNEALRIDLLKMSSLDSIKTNAESKLGMSIATKDNTTQIEVPSNYFEVENKSADEKQKTVFSKIMDAFSK